MGTKISAGWTISFVKMKQKLSTFHGGCFLAISVFYLAAILASISDGNSSRARLSLVPQLVCSNKRRVQSEEHLTT